MQRHLCDRVHLNVLGSAFQPSDKHSTVLQVLRLGNVVPDFKAETTQGPMHWHEWINDSWAILFSHPADFTVRDGTPSMVTCWWSCNLHDTINTPQ